MRITKLADIYIRNIVIFIKNEWKNYVIFLKSNYNTLLYLNRYKNFMVDLSNLLFITFTTY